MISMRNYLANEWQRGQAAKRGGGQLPLALEFETAGERFDREPADPGLSPEQAFDRNCAVEMIGRAIDALQTDYVEDGKGELFTALRAHIWGNTSPASFAEQAATLDMKPHALTVALLRLRKRLGKRLRTIVRQTVASEADVDAELRLMIAALGDLPSSK